MLVFNPIQSSEGMLVFVPVSNDCKVTTVRSISGLGRSAELPWPGNPTRNACINTSLASALKAIARYLPVRLHHAQDLLWAGLRL